MTAHPARRQGPGRVVALLGAESTGKTTVAAQLAAALRTDGHRCSLVDEALRAFCDREGRTPRRAEQAAIATEQTRRIELARAGHDIVIADTTALQIAVYSELVFGDRSLYPSAQRFQSGVDITLLMALDLPWLPDGLQRDGPHVRAPVDRLLRSALHRAGVCYCVVSGTGPERLANALAVVRHATRSAGTDADSEADAGMRREASSWRHACERCGDPQCERHLLPRP